MSTIIKSKVLNVINVNNSGETFFLGAYEIEHKGNTKTYILWHLVLIENMSSPVPLRINSACLTGDLFGGSMYCDCRWQLDYSMKYIFEKRNGLIIYSVDDTGRGNGVLSHLASLKRRQNNSLKKIDFISDYIQTPDKRDYGPHAAILKDLGIGEVELLTNNPEKLEFLSNNGVIIKKRIPVVIEKAFYLQEYLEFKKNTLGHFLFMDNN